MPEHVNRDARCFSIFLGALQKPKSNQSFYPDGRPKNKQGLGWMRAGDEKRPVRPMNALNFRKSARTDMACDAQNLLNPYAWMTRRDCHDAQSYCGAPAIRIRRRGAILARSANKEPWLP